MRSVCRAPSGPRWTGGADTNRAGAAGLQTGSRPCFRGILTVPFQHVGIISRRGHPTVLVKFFHAPQTPTTAGPPTLTSTRPSLGKGIPGEAGLGPPRGLCANNSGRPGSRAITHRSPSLPSYLVSCTSSTRCITGAGRAGLGKR